jgi:hypothetical protein
LRTAYSASRRRAFDIGTAIANYPGARRDGHPFAVDATGRIIVMGDASTRLVFATFDLTSIRKAQRGTVSLAGLTSFGRSDGVNLP